MPPDLQVGVIIPTHNRKEILKRVLDSVFNQTCAKDTYEVIVVDDGSSDGTEEYTRANCSPGEVRFVFLRQENKGPAAARNLAVKASLGELVLILNDDVIPERGLIEAHVRAHARIGPRNGVLGHVIPATELRQTPLLRYIESAESRAKLQDGQKLSHRHFITNNLSLRRDILFEAGLFDERFRYPIGEDIDLGYRLERLGFQLYFRKDAIGYHYHPFDFESYCRRMRMHGRNAIYYSMVANPAYELGLHGAVYDQFQPLSVLLRGRGVPKRLARWTVGKAFFNQPTMTSVHTAVLSLERQMPFILVSTLYRVLFSYEYYVGMKEGLHILSKDKRVSQAHVLLSEAVGNGDLDEDRD